MLLEQREKELTAIGASIGANCRPCIEHHINAGREAGLSEAELSVAVAAAQALRRDAVEQLASRVEELLGGRGAAPQVPHGAATSKDGELVAVGASVGANAHLLMRRHIAAALESGLTAAQLEAALKMAEHVQRRAGEITAEKATQALQEIPAGTFSEIGSTR